MRWPQVGSLGGRRGSARAGSPNHEEPRMNKSLKRYRAAACLSQGSRCFYCAAPIWLIEEGKFASEFGISLRQAKLFKCTAEHLQARQDEGSNRRSNIAAACLFCNKRRHAGRKVALTPAEYRRHVRARLAVGRRHQVAAFLRHSTGTEIVISA